MIHLDENLQPKDLQNLVLPMISIDQFESKIDDKKVIVVGFFVFDREPADDLCNFIDKCAVLTLDTEVSPAPTSEGYFLVFVEMSRNNLFPAALIDLVNQVNNLTAIKNWQFKCFDDNKIHQLSPDNLKKFVELDQSKVKPVVRPEDLPTEKKPPTDIKVQPRQTEPKSEEPDELKMPELDDKETPEDKAPEAKEPETKELEKEPGSQKVTPPANNIQEQVFNFLKESTIDKYEIKNGYLRVRCETRVEQFKIKSILNELPDALAESVTSNRAILNERILGPGYFSFVLENQNTVIWHGDKYLLLERPLDV